MKNLYRLTTSSVVACLLLVLSACASMSAQEKGIATGAVVGGVVGNVLCGGVLCTGAGAAVGGVIGNEVAKPKK
jgi:osmotically inducible lipoprotein OsmB